MTRGPIREAWMIGMRSDPCELLIVRIYLMLRFESSCIMLPLGVFSAWARIRQHLLI